SHRPLSLTPQFFAHKPLDLLFRPGVDASMFNRFNWAAPSMRSTPTDEYRIGAFSIRVVVAHHNIHVSSLGQMIGAVDDPRCG
ncbi:MAG: DUF4277 domain-containing protein, partial [Candidatus Tectomicrobia bacterium]|nr:DUF4277 domain-containing protein [Candidatus Tectomicrobia bacterium]